MKFVVDKEKAVEALIYIASRVAGVGRFHAAKILYFAEREHLRTYGRPIVGDRYIAMEHGPVPSFAYDVLKAPSAPAFAAMLNGGLVSVSNRFPSYKAGREPDLGFFSKSDLRCLDTAIDHCRSRSFGSISDETHAHSAWKNAAQDTEMSFDEFFEGVDDEVREYAEAFSSHGVL